MVIWSFSGYESVGSLVEEIKDSTNTLARALCLANALSVCIYFFSFLGSLGVDSEISNWDVGYFQEIGMLNCSS
jgi:amino acid transporter